MNIFYFKKGRAFMVKRTTDKERLIREEIISSLPHFWMYAVISGAIALILQLVGLIPPVIM